MVNVDWEDLRQFVALARTGSLSAAAANLAVSQVTVMRRMRRLETELGSVLFLRGRQGHRLTAAGLELLRSTREAEELIEDGVRRASARETPDRSRVRIVTTELVANWILVPHLRTLTRDSTARIEIDASPVERDLTDDADTVAVRFRRPAKGAYRARKLGVLPFGLYTARQASKVSLNDQAHIGWTGEFRDIGLSRWLRASFGHQDSAIALTTLEGHLRAARAGLGIAGLPCFIGDRDPQLMPVAAPAMPTYALTAWIVVSMHIAQQPRIVSAMRVIAAAFGTQVFEERVARS